MDLTMSKGAAVVSGKVPLSFNLRQITSYSFKRLGASEGTPRGLTEEETQLTAPCPQPLQGVQGSPGSWCHFSKAHPGFKIL